MRNTIYQQSQVCQRRAQTVALLSICISLWAMCSSLLFTHGRLLLLDGAK